MDEELAMAFSITDEGQKLEHYKHILSSVISSNDVARAKKFIDHVLSDAVPWNLSRQLLQRLAQGISTWDSSTQMDIVDYTLGQASDWKLEEAIELFNIGNEAGPVASASHSAPVENVIRWADDDTRGLKDSANNNIGLGGGGGGDDVRPPLPVVRDTLYDDATLYGASRMGYPSHEASTMIAFRNFEDEMRRPNVWETDQGATSMIENPRDNLASLYRPPFRLMFNGSFEKAKAAASAEDKWLLVNLQSTKEFSSHMLNRDTWGNETVAQSVSTSFIFWQVYDDTSEGRKVCTYYKLENIPVVLVIDPITGQKMRSWFGMVQPESLLEDLVPFMDGGPRDHHINLSHKRPRGNLSFDKKKDEVNDEDEELQKALAASLENIKDSSAVASDDKGAASDTIITEEETSSTMKPTYPSLPEEPKGDKSLLCRVGIRLPDGRRVQRNFLKTDPIQLLWSFCDSLLEGAGRKAFRLTEAIPGAKSLDYEAKLSFGESGLANSMISVAWE